VARRGRLLHRGRLRFAFKSFEELGELLGDLSDEEKAPMETGSHTEEHFYEEQVGVAREVLAEAGDEARFECPPETSSLARRRRRCDRPRGESV
jgi:hypothetical protein